MSLLRDLRLKDAEKLKVVLPEFFQEEKQSDLVKVNGFAWMEYRLFEERMMFHVALQDNMLIFVLEGEKVVFTDDGNYRIGPGNALFLKRGNYIMTQILEVNQKGYESLAFFLDQRFLREFVDQNEELFRLSPQDEEDSSGVCQVSMSPLARHTIESLLPHFVYPAKDPERILKLKFQEVLLSLLDCDENKALHRVFVDELSAHKKDLATYMKQNFTQPLRVEEFARRTGRSLSAFKKDFKTRFGIPPKTWINDRRLERARFLAEHSDYNVTEICCLVGFESLSHFIQLFKKRFGVTPKQMQLNATVIQ